jgi:hypothetical protein
MRKLLVLVLTILGISGLASAQVPTGGNIFLGYSYFNADANASNRSNLNGWNGSLEGKVFPFVGIVADVGGYYGTHDHPAGCAAPIGLPCPDISGNSSVYTAMFGPRVSFSVGRIRPFAHALVGVSHIKSDADSDTSLANAFGGGIDFHLIPLLAWRFQGDELQTRFFSATQNNFRFSTGIVFHF